MRRFVSMFGVSFKLTHARYLLHLMLKEGERTKVDYIDEDGLILKSYSFTKYHGKLCWSKIYDYEEEKIKKAKKAQLNINFKT